MHDIITQFAEPILLADIGGTNARFLLVGSDGQTMAGPVTLPGDDYASLDDAIAGAIDELGEAPASAVLALAGPIGGERFDMTNRAWTVEPSAMTARFGWNRLLLLNDFEAQAIATARFADDELTPIGPGEAKRGKNRVIVGPGTGLGVAALLQIDGKAMPIATEGGHMDMGPRTADEFDLWPHIQRLAGRRICAETLISGPGLTLLHSAIAQSAGAGSTSRSPAEIYRMATEEDDAHAERALRLMMTLLGRVCGDLALAFDASGGVFVAGGISPRLLPLLPDSTFRYDFEDKPPYEDRMRSIATLVVTAADPGLRGLQSLIAEPDHYRIETSERLWSR